MKLMKETILHKNDNDVSKGMMKIINRRRISSIFSIWFIVLDVTAKSYTLKDNQTLINLKLALIDC